ncbi:TonB-dependent receptor [Sphingobium tyrosinilyticum]|uniref:TonB-dependent receptor n=1 Tax=Sphingobium tyrosinilyticum TaxID=2715436 RepID=A0ABV9F5F9_9SPHN
MHRPLRIISSVGALAASLASYAHAQDATSEPSLVNDDIVVTARRREESLQEVPQTVNVVSGASVEKLNITKFEDIKSVVPGLSLQSTGDGFSFRASLRGVGYDSIASVPPNVEFYVNEALVSPFSLFQSMYDVGQIEVLRGPQGTLRGRASPSGQITVTTRRPNLDDVGVMFNGSATDRDAYNGSAAINIPLLPGVAALRLAGLVDQNHVDQVRPLNGGRKPFSNTESGRISLRVEPADWFDGNVMYQVLHRRAESYRQVESLSLSQPGAPLHFGSNSLITGRDRRSIGDDPIFVNEDQKLLIGNANVRFAGQQLSYVGSWFKVDQDTRQPQDSANIFPGQSVYQLVPVAATQKTHELRLSSVDRIMGIFDYTVGAVYVQTIGKNPITSPSIIAFNGGAPAGTPGLPVYLTTANTIIQGAGKQTEKSYFGNLTAHIGERAEISGGLRHITFNDKNFLAIPSLGVTLQDIDQDYDATVYNFTAKYRFNDELMVYANTGSSWRKGTQAVGIFRPLTPLLESFVRPHPEKSKSYEIGMKANLFDRKLELNVTAFHQKFDGFLYRNNTPVNFVDLDFSQFPTVTQRLGQFNFLANVPAKVSGVELQALFRPSRHISLDAQFAYAKGKISNGQVACNDANLDGVPDGGTTDVTAIPAAGVAVCSINDRVSNAPNWSLTLQPEYSMSLSDRADAYLRGLFTYSPNNPNDPTNAYDKVKGYGLLNLYLGVRDPDGAWEIGAFAKNITNTFRVLSRGDRPLQTNALDAGAGFASVPFQSNYVQITSTPPREFGVSLRVALGAR